MANYFYVDEHGKKRGPVSEMQLQSLARQGTITATTPLETEGGHQGLAGQIPGLKFNTAAPLPSVQPDRYYDKDEPLNSFTPSSSYRPVRESVESTTWWLCDWSFQDIRVHVINLWFCRIIYIICWIVAILSGLWWTFLIFMAATSFKTLIPLFAIPFVWLGVIFSLFLTRLYLEFFIVLCDWMVETTKAAKLYMKNNKR